MNLASSGGKDQEDDEYECQVCNANLFVSLVGFLMTTMMMAMRRDDDGYDEDDDDYEKG